MAQGELSSSFLHPQFLSSFISGSSRYDVPIDFIGGSLGATASVYVGQPLDTLKVKMQTFPQLYPRLGLCFQQTLRQEGVVRGLYAGTVPSLAANVAENSILFAAYGACQKLVARAASVDQVDQLGLLHNGLAGFLAAFWSSLALCPTELVKCRLQAMRESFLTRGLQPPTTGPYQLTRSGSLSLSGLSSVHFPGKFWPLTECPGCSGA